MRYASYARTGPAEVLEIVDAPTPAPQGDEVLLEIRSSGINPFDVKQRAGQYGEPKTLPQRTGFDGAGVVVAVGPDATGFVPGQRLLTSGALGTAGTHLIVRPRNLVPLPDGVDFNAAAAIGVPVGTAYQSLRSLGVGPGDTLLIHGGSGAVGQAAVQLALIAGADHVIATAGARNLARLEELGATGIEYGPGLLDRVRAASSTPVTVVLDLAGTDDAFDSVALLEDRSRWATIVAGARADTAGLAAYSGGSAVPMTPDQHALRRAGIVEGLHLVADGRLRVEIAEVLPLDRIADAHRLVESGAARGKVLVRP